ncbi:hypothetical protein CLF_109273, partial [Clonorchis sinensis]
MATLVVKLVYTCPLYSGSKPIGVPLKERASTARLITLNNDHRDHLLSLSRIVKLYYTSGRRGSMTEHVFLSATKFPSRYPPTNIDKRWVCRQRRLPFTSNYWKCGRVASIFDIPAELIGQVIWPRRRQMMPTLVTFALAIVITFHSVISYPTSSYLGGSFFQWSKSKDLEIRSKDRYSLIYTYQRVAILVVKSVQAFTVLREKALKQEDIDNYDNTDRDRQLDIPPILHEEQDLSDYFPNDALLYSPTEHVQPSTFQSHGQYQSSADAELSDRDWMAYMQRQSPPHLLRTNGFTLRTQRLSRLNQAVKRDDLGCSKCERKPIESLLRMCPRFAKTTLTIMDKEIVQKIEGYISTECSALLNKPVTVFNASHEDVRKSIDYLVTVGSGVISQTMCGILDGNVKPDTARRAGGHISSIAASVSTRYEGLYCQFLPSSTQRMSILRGAAWSKYCIPPKSLVQHTQLPGNITNGTFSWIPVKEEVKEDRLLPTFPSFFYRSSPPSQPLPATGRFFRWSLPSAAIPTVKSVVSATDTLIYFFKPRYIFHLTAFNVLILKQVRHGVHSHVSSTRFLLTCADSMKRSKTQWKVVLLKVQSMDKPSKFQGQTVDVVERYIGQIIFIQTKCCWNNNLLSDVCQWFGHFMAAPEVVISGSPLNGQSYISFSLSKHDGCQSNLKSLIEKKSWNRFLIPTRFRLHTSADPGAAAAGCTGVCMALSHRVEVSVLDWIPLDSRFCAVCLAMSVKEPRKWEVDQCPFVTSAFASTDCSSDADRVRCGQIAWQLTDWQIRMLDEFTRILLENLFQMLGRDCHFLHSAGNFACGTAPPGARKHWISDQTVALVKSRRNIPTGPEHNPVRGIIGRQVKGSEDSTTLLQTASQYGTRYPFFGMLSVRITIKQVSGQCLQAQMHAIVGCKNLKLRVGSNFVLLIKRDRIAYKFRVHVALVRLVIGRP